MFRLRHALLTIGLTLHFGCSRSDEPVGLASEASPPSPPPAGQPAAPGDSAAPSSADRSAAAGASEERPGSIEQQVARLIYRADFAVASSDPDASSNRLLDWVKLNGGYMVTQEDQALTFRVPSKRFDDAIAQVEQAGDLLHRNVQVQDVTEQYYDLETRLQSAEALHTRLTVLLERSNSVKDTLEVERELSRVSAELEVLKGKLRRLSELVAFCTLSVTWSQLEADVPLGSPRLPFAWLGTLGLSHLTQLEAQ